MRPEFGCRVHDHVFAPINASTAGAIARDVRYALELREPRIDVQEVLISFDQADLGTLYIDIHYTIRSTNDSRNLVFPFYVIPEEPGAVTSIAPTNPAAVPAGIAKRAVSRRKPRGSYGPLLVARVRKKAGMPIVTAETNVRCRGRNGNGRVNSAAVMMATRLITFLDTNRFATRSTLPITRRPSANTDGRCENLPSSNTS